MCSIEDVLFEAYGVAPDHERIAYYRLRWEE
jgi:aminoglycoside phosphotransferase